MFSSMLIAYPPVRLRCSSVTTCRFVDGSAYFCYYSELTVRDTSDGPITAESANRPALITVTVPEDTLAVPESPNARRLGFSGAAFYSVTEALSRSPPQLSRTIVAEVYAFIFRLISASRSSSVIYLAYSGSSVAATGYSEIGVSAEVSICSPLISSAIPMI